MISGCVNEFPKLDFRYFRDPLKDLESALAPLAEQIADVEENIEALVRRNEVVDEEFQGMKSDIASLSDKILTIKVSFVIEFLSVSRCFILGKY